VVTRQRPRPRASTFPHRLLCGGTDAAGLAVATASAEMCQMHDAPSPDWPFGAGRKSRRLSTLGRGICSARRLLSLVRAGEHFRIASRDSACQTDRGGISCQHYLPPRSESRRKMGDGARRRFRSAEHLLNWRGSMITQADLQHHLRREREERQRANQASSAEARLAHSALADSHARRAAIAKVRLDRQTLVIRLLPDPN